MNEVYSPEQAARIRALLYKDVRTYTEKYRDLIKGLNYDYNQEPIDLINRMFPEEPKKCIFNEKDGFIDGN